MRNSKLKSGSLVPVISIITTFLLLFSGCTAVTTQTSVIPTESGTATTVQTTPPVTESSIPTTTTTAITVPSTIITTAPITTPVIPSITIPSPLVGNISLLNSTQYVVFAWNDLGMHCSNPTYDKAVLLPPYNNIWAQVVKRGNPPQIITSGLTVEYQFVNNTSSYNKEFYGQFWDNAKALFGVELVKDTGLNLVDPAIHNGMSGTMVAKADHFQADGIPITPINDDGTWNPYQIGQITVKDASGNIIARTLTTVPISSEINCSKCHGADAFQDVLIKHDNTNGTSLVSMEPVLCAGCHGDPALGVAKTGNKYLSDAVHGFHSTVSPQPSCYDCHPGAVTKCSRSIAHTSVNGNCITCHGDLADVAGSIQKGRVPWANEPACVTCHPGVAQVDTHNSLYRNSTGHGGMYCTSCHSSPHAMVPTSVIVDNYQSLQYQGAAKAIGSCGACHSTSKGHADLGDFMEEHAGNNPRVPNACAICHTAVSIDTTRWPHAFQWHATQGAGSLQHEDED